MTVRELIELLKDMPQDIEVWRTSWDCLEPIRYIDIKPLSGWGDVPHGKAVFVD